jgi:hypothetical protein
LSEFESDLPFQRGSPCPPRHGSRVPIWQIVNPALSPDGKWLAQALTDGFTTNFWALSTTTGKWHQITDFGDSDIVLLEGLMNAGRQ